MHGTTNIKFIKILDCQIIYSVYIICTAYSKLKVEHETVIVINIILEHGV